MIVPFRPLSSTLRPNFRDNIDEAAKFGISAIIQPGGSVRDEEVIQACNEHSLTMVLTNYRHFNH